MEQSHFWQPASERGELELSLPFFFVCTFVPCLCCVACSVLCLQGRAKKGTFAASEDIATGALPAQQSCLPTLYLQPLCLCKQHFCTHLKAAAKLGLCLGLSVQSRSPQEKHRHLPCATLTSQSQDKCWNCGTWITYGVLFLYPAWAARQGRAAYHRTGRDSNLWIQKGRVNRYSPVLIPACLLGAVIQTSAQQGGTSLISAVDIKLWGPAIQNCVASTGPS